MPASIRKDGDFCWINIVTPEPAQAREFFAALLGWTYGDLSGMGSLIKVDGHNVGGLFDLAAPTTPKGTPPHIGIMVKVDDAGATCEKARKLGGRAEPPFDIMGNGIMGMITDPNGARFDLWQPKKEPGTDVDRMAHGAPTWFETITSDVARAEKYYTSLFGWTTETKPMPEFNYTVVKLDGQGIGGIMPILPRMGKIPSHWGVYFSVKDADQTAKLVTKLGGKLCIPVTPIDNVGRFCGITSPQGVMFYAIQCNM